MRLMFMATVFLASFAGPVFADDCDDYAAYAMSQVLQAQKKGCLGMASSDGRVALVGTQWSTSLAEHANWCRAHSPAEVQDAHIQRSAWSVLCIMCNSAVTEAVQQTQAAIDLKCGFSGAEWDNNSFATQMQACFKGQWTGGFLVAFPQMNYENRDRAGKLAFCKQEAGLRAKMPASNSQYTKRPYLERHIRNGTANAVKDAAADPDCKWCKSTNSSVTGAPQRDGSSAMDRLGDLNNNNNLGSVSGNSGGAQIGKTATPRPTSAKAQPSADAVVRAPSPSNSVNGGFKSKPIPNPTFNDPNPIR